MIPSELEARAAIERWFRSALEGVEPTRTVGRHLRITGGSLDVGDARISLSGRVFAAAIGKAALGMAWGAFEALGDALEAGFIITKDGHLDRDLPARFAARETAHPVPDVRCVQATHELMDRVGRYGSNDIVVALISGGGSSLMEAPVESVSLEEIAATTRLLLSAGAPIHDLNAVRVPLSRVKGGGLRQAASNARFVSLLLSDVLGNDPRVIASGPTVDSDFTGAGAVAVLERYRVREHVPGSVVRALGAPRAEEAAIDWTQDVVEVVADNATAVSAFAFAAESDGHKVERGWDARQGEASELAREWVFRAVSSPADVVLGGGEATVTVRGDGRGGRNTEFALAAALELERIGRRDWVVASLATDGEDAVTGHAGAIASALSVARMRDAGIDPAAALIRNDSATAFEAAGGLVTTGPTGTNVNDIYVAVRLA